METESEEREACLRRHRERDGARWASPTVDQTQARLEHNASYRHTHLQQLATNRQRRLESEMAEESSTRFFFSAISIFHIPNRNNHQDLLINCHSKYIPILLVLIDVFHYAIIEAFVMLFH